MAIKAISIVEICNEDSQAGFYDYDLLPPNVKASVDKALADPDTLSATINIYDDGLQHLFTIKQPEITIGTIITYMGQVTFYDENEN